jgi:hypothetical protein
VVLRDSEYLGSLSFVALRGVSYSGKRWHPEGLGGQQIWAVCELNSALLKCC